MKPASRAHHKAPLGLRTVAVFEFAKGLLVLMAGLGLLSLIHGDAQTVAENIVRLLHLNPARRYPRVFIEAASRLTDTRLWFLALAAAIYAAVRFVETYGLWHERPWAEWFAVLSAGNLSPGRTLPPDKPAQFFESRCFAGELRHRGLSGLSAGSRLPKKGGQ